MGKYSDHSTYTNKEGTEVPSVTTILKVLNKTCGAILRTE